MQMQQQGIEQLVTKKNASSGKPLVQTKCKLRYQNTMTFLNACMYHEFV